MLYICVVNSLDVMNKNDLYINCKCRIDYISKYAIIHPNGSYLCDFFIFDKIDVEFLEKNLYLRSVPMRHSLS